MKPVKPNKLRLKVSWTILNTWASGRRDDAIQMIAGTYDVPQTPAMANGSRLHDIVATKKLRLIPELTDAAIFEDMRPADNVWVNYFKVPLFDWLDLSGVIDVVDPKAGIIVDWKASVRRATEHPAMQIYLYALATQLKYGITIHEGIFATIKEEQDGAVICSDYAAFKITPSKLAFAKSYAETIGSEIYSFLHS